MLSVMLGLAGSVLLVVCLNISGMMLVRGTTRERELSIRAALGAGRQRLIQHLFFEALLLAFVAAALSTFVLFGIPAIVAWWIWTLRCLEEIDLDAVNVVIASGLCLVVSVLFGLVAGRSLQPSQSDPRDQGRCRRRRHADDSRASPRGDGADRHRRAVSGDQRRDARPRANRRFWLSDRWARRGEAAGRRQARREAGFSIRAVATICNRPRCALGRGGRGHADRLRLPRISRRARGRRETFVTAHVTRVGENFLETVGAPLLRGRTITAEDRSDGRSRGRDFRTARRRSCFRAQKRSANG